MISQPPLRCRTTMPSSASTRVMHKPSLAKRTSPQTRQYGADAACRRAPSLRLRRPWPIVLDGACGRRGGLKCTKRSTLHRETVNATADFTLSTGLVLAVVASACGNAESIIRRGR